MKILLVKNPDALWLEATRKVYGHAPHECQNLNYYFSAHIDDSIVGLAQLIKENNLWIMDSLRVIPAYRRQGVGRKLVEARITFLKKNGASEVWYCCANDNVFSLKCHQGFDFVEYRDASPEEAPAPSKWYRHIL